MVGINVPIPVPMAFHSFGGWKASLSPFDLTRGDIYADMGSVADVPAALLKLGGTRPSGLLFCLDLHDFSRETPVARRICVFETCARNSNVCCQSAAEGDTKDPVR